MDVERLWPFGWQLICVNCTNIGEFAAMLNAITLNEQAIRVPSEGRPIPPIFAIGCPHQPGLRKVPANETLWCEGEERTHVFIIRSGAICFSRMLPDGRRIVLGFAYPGDMIGVGSDHHYCDAQTLQATRLEAMTAAAFKRAIISDPALKTRARAAADQALSAAYHHVVVISKLSANERLASFLMALSVRNEKHGLSPLSVVLPMRRLDIADYLGLTIETVSRTFTQFKCAGLIAMDQASIVIFTDIQKLRSLASGEGDNVHSLQRCGGSHEHRTRTPRLPDSDRLLRAS